MTHFLKCARQVREREQPKMPAQDFRQVNLFIISYVAFWFSWLKADQNASRPTSQDGFCCVQPPSAVQSSSTYEHIKKKKQRSKQFKITRTFPSRVLFAVFLTQSWPKRNRRCPVRRTESMWCTWARQKPKCQPVIVTAKTVTESGAPRESSLCPKCQMTLQ